MATIQTYDIGDGIRSTAQFRDLGGNSASPTTVVFSVKDANGAVTTPSVSNAGSGMYYADFVVTPSAGTWAFRWQGTGAVQAVEEGTFQVRQSLFP